MGVKDANQLLFKGGSVCNVPKVFDTVLVDGSFVKMLSMSVAASMQNKLYENVSAHILYQDLILRSAIISKNKLQRVCARMNDKSKMIIFIDNHAALQHEIDLSKYAGIYGDIVKNLYIPHASIKGSTWDKRAKGSKITFKLTGHDEVLYDSQYRQLLKEYRELFLDKVDLKVESINQIKLDTDDEELSTKFKDWLIMENYLVCNPFVNNFYPSALTLMYTNILRQILPNTVAYVSNSETDFEITKYVSAHPDEKICIVSGDTDYSFYNGWNENVYINDLQVYKHPYSSWCSILDKEHITKSMLLRISYLLGNDYFPGFVRDSLGADMVEDLYKVLNINNSFAECGKNQRKTISSLFNDCTKFLVNHSGVFQPREIDLIIISACETLEQRSAYITSLLVLENIESLISDDGLKPIKLTNEEMIATMTDTLKSTFPLLYKFKNCPPTLQEIIVNNYNAFIKSCGRGTDYERKYKSSTTKDTVREDELTKDFIAVCEGVINAVNSPSSPLMDSSSD